MTYLQARAAMETDGCLYRPHWPLGTYLHLEGISGRKRIVKYVGNQPASIWVGTPEDFAAIDWKTEIFVSLAAMPHPGIIPVMK